MTLQKPGAFLPGIRSDYGETLVWAYSAQLISPTRVSLVIPKRQADDSSKIEAHLLKQTAPSGALQRVNNREVWE